MADNPDLKAFKQRILGKDYFVMDQWQLEELAKVVRALPGEGGHATACRRRRCGKCHVEPAADGRAGGGRVAWRSTGRRRRVAVIPKGPYVLPYVA